MAVADEDFETWESVAIEYDIAIDEESYNEILRLNNCEKESETVLCSNREDFLKRIRETVSEIDAELINDDPKIKVQITPSKNPKNAFWAFLFLTKKIRASLQSQHTDSAIKKLDWLVDFLILNIGWKVNNTKEYLLILFELTALTTGEQSLGFSEKARELLLFLKQRNGIKDHKAHLYEALIYYNQGLAKSHMHQYHDALKDYDNAIEKFNKKGKSNGSLWDNYVFYPALLQKADVLSKMQFSYNALKTLDEIKDCDGRLRPSPFLEARKEIQRAFCYLDLSDYDEFDKHFEIIGKLQDKYGKIYFKRTSLKLEENETPESMHFLNAKLPQDLSDSNNPPSLLGSHYNSLIIERAKEAVREEIYKGAFRNKWNDIGIFEFLERCLSQCKDNRFDRLTLKENILEFMELLMPLIDSFNEGPSIVKIFGRLVNMLDGPNGEMKFSVEEIDPSKNPSIPQHVVDKALKIFEDVNDKILSEWSKCISINEKPKKIFLHGFQMFFKFEKDLIECVENKQTNLNSYKKLTLGTRNALLKKVITYFDDPIKIKEIECQLVCICSDNEECTAKGRCLKELLSGISQAYERDHCEEWEVLKINDYDKILNREANQFHKHITDRSFHPVPDSNSKGNSAEIIINYIGLRRWNSFTPELSFSVGGGYFVFLSNSKGKVLTGIAVDPGFDFIRNFFRQGFSLTDIDLILLTHGHPDHIRDFPAIVELLHERRRLPRDKKIDHKIYSIMSLGCYQRLKEYIANPPYRLLFYDTIVLDIDKQHNQPALTFVCPDGGESHPRPTLIVSDTNREENDPKVKMKIEPFEAFHQDHSESDSYGFNLRFFQENNQISIGFTGDSKWLSNYARKFTDCDIICSHIGSIVETNKSGRKLEDYRKVGQAERLIRTKNHPYLFGEILFLQDWREKTRKKTIVLISEFGEEMKGNIRPDLIKRFNNLEKGCWSRFAGSEKGSEEKSGECKTCVNCDSRVRVHNLLTIPVDVGLRVSVPLGLESAQAFSQKVYCCICEQFVEPNEIDYEIYGYEEAIFYICKTCKRSKSIDVRHSIYQKNLESGRELKKDET